MRRLLTHAAVILPIAFTGPSALAQGASFEPTRAEMMAITSGVVIGSAKACGIEESSLDALTKRIFRAVRAKARDDAEFHSAAQYFNFMYGRYESQSLSCSDARALFGRWDSMLDEAMAK